MTGGNVEVTVLNAPFPDRRPAMTLLSGVLDVFSHCCRIVLFEKDIECAIEYVSGADAPSRIGEHNPYGETPTLIDRDITLYNMWVILEYLDERFPHPPLMPVDPVTRAKARLTVSRFTRDWIQPLYDLGTPESRDLPADLKKSLYDGMVALSPIVSERSFFPGPEYSLVDVFMAPLLWRLPSLGIDLPRQATSLMKYGEMLFGRPSFVSSLSDAERELRGAVKHQKLF